MPLDSRVIAAIILMGLAAVVTKAMDLWQWHVARQPLEPVVIRTQDNGGVASGTARDVAMKGIAIRLGGLAFLLLVAAPWAAVLCFPALVVMIVKPEWDERTWDIMLWPVGVAHRAISYGAGARVTWGGR